MRERFEDGFEAWAGVVARWRYAFIALVFVATALSATQIPHITVDTSNESYLLEDDPARLAYDDLREQFGRDQIRLISLEPRDIFDLEFLEYLRELHEAIAKALGDDGAAEVRCSRPRVLAGSGRRRPPRGVLAGGCSR